MQRKFTVLGAAAAAGALALTLAGPAQAAPQYVGCRTTGANGGASFNMSGATDKIKVELNAQDDKKGDGAHARVRLVTKDVDGKKKYWRWRSNTSSAPKYWKTTASNDSGIFDVGVQAARYDGNKLKNYCTDWM